MRFKEKTPTGRWGKRRAFFIDGANAEIGRSLHPYNDKRTTDVHIRLEGDGMLTVSWSEIEFFATLYHKYKEGQ